VGVVGHVEWVEFVRVDALPTAGEIVHAREVWEEPAGGGAVAAVQLAKLAGGALLLTALGDDDRGERARTLLDGRDGLRLVAARRRVDQRRAITFVDGRGERTITVIGERLVPAGDDRLPWDALGELDAVYLTGGDRRAVERARAARVLVCTARAIGVLREAAVSVDVLVASAADPGERYEPGMLDPPPALVVRTEGARGGEWIDQAGRSGRWSSEPPGAVVVDAYGCGDSFAAGLTFALGAGLERGDALRLAARCGAACLTGRGPYHAQLRAESTRPSA